MVASRIPEMTAHPTPQGASLPGAAHAPSLRGLIAYRNALVGELQPPVAARVAFDAIGPVRAAIQSVIRDTILTPAPGWAVPIAISVSIQAFGWIGEDADLRAVQRRVEDPDVQAQATVLADELQRCGWTPKYRTADLSAQQRADLFATVTLGLVIFLFLVGLQYPEIDNAARYAETLLAIWYLLNHRQDA